MLFLDNWVWDVYLAAEFWAPDKVKTLNYGRQGHIDVLSQGTVLHSATWSHNRFKVGALGCLRS